MGTPFGHLGMDLEAVVCREPLRMAAVKQKHNVEKNFVGEDFGKTHKP